MHKNSKKIIKENNALNFLKKFSKIVFFKQLISENNLKFARLQIKNQLKKVLIFYARKNSEILTKMSKKWFFNVHQLLLKGKFQYPKQNWAFKLNKKSIYNFFTINNIRMKIIEKTILNGLEKVFEGMWYWKPITEKNYLVVKTQLNIQSKNVKKNKNGWFLKSWKQNEFLQLSNFFLL